MKNGRVLNRINARELTAEEAVGVAAGTQQTYWTMSTSGPVDAMTVED